jgi:PadR family transcriptional regulator, regulatory protein PadR
MLRDLSLGFIRVHILFHAAEAPAFGVALMDELARHGYRVGPGTLYPILHKLEREGYLRREEQTVQGKVRKYYRTTQAGTRLLARARAQLRELVEEVFPEGEQDHGYDSAVVSHRRGGGVGKGERKQRPESSKRQRQPR